MSVAGLILSILLSHFKLHIFRDINGQANLIYLQKCKEHAYKVQDIDTLILKFFFFFSISPLLFLKIKKNFFN